MMGEAGAVNLTHLAANCLAKDKVYYKGHAVAAVAATTTYIAEEAAKLIKVEYEVLPSVTWVLDAMKPDAPILHDDLRTDEMGKKGDKPTNIQCKIVFEKGQPADGFKQADVVVEHEFRTASVHQGYIEPHAAVAMWNEDGRLKIWSATQGAFNARQQVSELLQIPVSQVVVVPCEIGGGFGGKIIVYLEPVAALLSRKCGRPVKLTMQRSEVFEGTGPTPGSFMRVKLARRKTARSSPAKPGWRTTAAAFPAASSARGRCASSAATTFRTRGSRPTTSSTTSRTRRPIAPRLDARLLRDRTSHRRTGRKAQARPDRVPPEKRRQRRHAPRRWPGLSARRPRRNARSREEQPALAPSRSATNAQGARPLASDRGRGIASGFWFNIGGVSSCSANVNDDGTVTLLEGSTDIGGTRTSIAMQLAETLGIRAEDVKPQVADTDSVGYTVPHRRQPRDLRHRPGRLQARPRPRRANEGPRREALGMPAAGHQVGERHVSATTASG